MVVDPAACHANNTAAPAVRVPSHAYHQLGSAQLLARLPNRPITGAPAAHLLFVVPIDKSSLIWAGLSLLGDDGPSLSAWASLWQLNRLDPCRAECRSLPASANADEFF